MAKERYKTMAAATILKQTSLGIIRLILVFGCFIAFADCAKSPSSKSMFKFTRPSYVATMPENARGRVYAVPVEGRMGVSLPWSGVIAHPHLANRNKAGQQSSSENSSSTTTSHHHPWHNQLQAHHQSLVRFRISSSSGDKQNFFKAESEIIGDFAYLRIRLRSSLDVDLNRELTPEYSLRVKAVYRRQGGGGGGGGGRNLEALAEIVLRITDQNDLSPVFLPEHYRTRLDRRTTPMFSNVARVTANDGDIGLNGEVYYQLLNETEYFTVHPTSGVVTSIRPLADLPSNRKSFNLSVAAVDRASRLFADSRHKHSQSGNVAAVDIEILDNDNNDDEKKKSATNWIVKTAKEDDTKRFDRCGSVADGLCAIVTSGGGDSGDDNNKSIVERLELEDSNENNNDDDDSAKYFYVHRSSSSTGRRRKEEFEIRSISTAPVGLYNLTLFPLGLQLLINISASSSNNSNVASCEDKDFDMWMNRMDFEYEVPEWAPDGYLVGDVRLDPRVGETRFELKKAEEETERKLPFVVDEKMGILYLKLSDDNRASSPFNYKRRATYEFFVHGRRTKCRPEKEEKRKIVVRIKDCNDHAPKFVDKCDRLILNPNHPPSATDVDIVLCKFGATDEDVGDNGKITYDLVTTTNSSSMARFFEIDHDRGELVLKNSIELLAELTGKSGKKTTTMGKWFDVRASDRGWPLKRVSEKTVLIAINETADRRWSIDAGGGKDNQRELVQENRHQPKVAAEWSFEIEENAPIDRHVGVIQASDSDGGFAGVLLYTIEHDSSAAPFDIDLYNGSIRVFRPLDRERREEYSFRVIVRDLGVPSRRAETKVVVKILDTNDNAPKFDKPTYRIRLKENTDVGASILQLRAFDSDSDGNGRIRYTLVTRTPYFDLDSETGVLKLKSELDRERSDRHRLLVQAQDFGQPPMSALVNVTVIVQDVNDNAPFCRSTSSKAYIPEDYPAGSLVTCVDADDLDTGENGRISYRLVDVARKSINASDEVPFTIDAATGCIRLAWLQQQQRSATNSNQRKSTMTTPYSELILNYERQQFYNLTVELSDFGNPRPLKSTCNVFVEVLDVNENRFPPKFVNVIGDFGSDEEDEPVFAVETEIYENEMAPTFVKQVKAVDPDASENMPEPRVIYSIVDGDGLGVFTIDQEGRIYANRSLDREAKPFYWLIVTATDRSPVPLSASIDVFIRVLDRNDNSPIPSKSIYYTSIMENSPPNTVLVRIEASDADLVSIPIPQMDGDEEDDERGDHEVESMMAKVQQQQPSTDFAQSSLSYKITGGDPQSFFEIDSRTGDITTHRRMLDRETTPKLELDVTISDNGEPEPLITTVTVIVRVEDENDHAPVIVFPSKVMNFDIPEQSRRRARNKGKNFKETFLCRTFAFDEDEGRNGEIAYSILQGNEQHIFRIDSETGSIFALENSTWNDSQTFILTIRATDNGLPPKHSERRVHLSVVSDGPDAKHVDPKSIKIQSNLVTSPLHISAVDPIGHRVGLFEATVGDGSEERRIWYYLLEGNVDNAFALRPDTGRLFLAKKPTQTTYNLKFLATVDGFNGAEGLATVIVQPIIEDERPQFSQDPIHLRVSENQNADTVLLRLSDYLKSTYDREEIRFFLSDNYYAHNNTGGARNSNDGIFQLDAKSGTVYLKQSLDCEHQSRYQFRVGARSLRGKIGYTIVDVQVMDVNEHAPAFINRHVQLRISQMTNPGTVIYQLTAFDGDEGANGRLTYSLTMGNYKDAFGIDQQTGALRLLRSLTKADLTTEFVLSVKVEDGGRPVPLFDTATLRILLTSGGESSDDRSSGVIHFTQDLYSFRASEKLSIGGLIGHVQADGGGSVEYGILDDAGGYFHVHPLTGAVTLRRSFDFEQSSHAEAAIKAWSPGAVPPTSEGTARLVVTLTDGNDHGPIFEKLFYAAAIEENSPAGTVVAIVGATDADTGQAGVVTYHIVDEWARQYFEIDRHTGAIRSTQSLDYEREGQQRFEFSVAAEDLGDPIMYSTSPALVEIKVIDTNDSPPVFDSKSYEFVVHTPTVPGMRLGRIEAADADMIGAIEYYLRKAPSCWQLDVDRRTGDLEFSSDWSESKLKNSSAFTCKLIASDGLHEAEADIRVKLEPPYVQGANGQRFEQARYEVEILENSSDLKDGTVLKRLRLINIDPYEAIAFKFLNDEDDKTGGPYLALNPTTGALMATEYTRNLDRETTPLVTYLVEARFTRRLDSPPIRCVVIVKVLDANDNDPRFVGLPYSTAMSMKSSSATNQSVFRARAIDPDEGANGRVQYSLANDQPMVAKLFKIDGSTGDIVVIGDLETAEKKSFQIRIVAKDSGSPQRSATASIDVRLVSASTPVFPKAVYNVSVLEGPSAVGAVLLEANAFGIPSVANTVYGYTIVDTDESSTDASHFDLDFITGRLVLRKPLVNDRERKTPIRLPVRVRDYGASSSDDQSWSDATIEVHVRDYNDHAPRFEMPLYVINVSENASTSGTVPLATLGATDDDEGVNAQFTYALRSSADRSDSYFRLNPQTGALMLAKRLDYEKQKKHVLTVEAKDFGTPSLSSTTKVHVHASDSNDNPPAFTQMAFTVELASPKWAAGQFVGQALASDPDECDRGRLRYTIFGGNDGDWFKIDERSGVLRTARASSILHGAPPSEISLVLTVSDGVHSATCRFLIKIRSGTSVVGMTKFSKAVYQARVKERSAPGTFVTEIRVDDRSNGGSGIPSLRYRLVGSSVFRMEETTGKIFTSRQLDSTTKPVHYLTILAEKWSDFTVVAHCRLQITVINENNRPPKFLAERFLTTITSETKPNTIVLKIRAVDQDRDDILEYSLDSKSSSNNFEDYFFLDSNTGALALRRNAEAAIGSVFKATVRVTDRGNPPQRTSAPLEIRVISEETAGGAQLITFARLEYIYTVREDVKIGTEIGHLDVMRRGSGDSQNYRFAVVTPRSASTGVDWISLGERTGMVRVIERMDRESTNELQFYVSSTRVALKDIGSMALVRILIEDTDDNGPVFENEKDGSTVVSVSEDLPIGGMVTVFAASDPDSGEAGRVTYWIDDESDGQASLLPFKIDSKTGWLRTTVGLDRETRDSYSFKIVAGAVHVAELRSSLNVTVKVIDSNDQKPIFERKEYSFQLENGYATMPGYVIGRILATDADLPPNNEVAYFIVGGNERGIFDVRSTGEIYLARKIETDDRSNEYQLKILASDGTFEDSTSVKVNVRTKADTVACNADSFVCPSSKSISVNEDEPIGKIIDRLPQPPAGFKYRTIDGSTILEFTIKDNGEIVISRPLDYEKRTSYVINAELISIDERGGRGRCASTAECVVRISIDVQDVNDCSPQIDDDSLPKEISILENYNSTLPHFIGRVRAIDADSGLGGRVRYELKMEHDGEEDKNLFTIDNASGTIFLWRPLDRERRDFYNLTIMAVDGGRPKSLSSQRSILIKVLDVNDNPPAFVQTSYVVSAPEDTPVGATLVRVEAASVDSGENSVVTYSIEKSDAFEIDSKIGEIRLRQSLDYESAKEHTIIVTATDHGKPPLSSTVEFRLRVTDVNDNEPIFEKRHYTVRVPENVAVKSRLVRVMATDADSDENGRVGYRIEPTNRYFQVTSDGQDEPGWIVLAEALDYEKMITHEFQIMALDHGQPSKSSVAVVTVEVEDINDNAPKVLNCNRTLVVKAHLSTTTPLLTFQSIDADGPSNGKPFHYSLVDGQTKDGSSAFRLEPSGALFALQSPLEMSEYYVQISAKDNGDPSMTGHCRLHVRVTDESRFPPRLVNTSFLVLSYMGEMGSGGVIGRTVATDDDPKDSIRYSIANVSKIVNEAEYDPNVDAERRPLDEKEMFSVDSDDGRISAAAELPPGEYVLIVSASDGRFDAYAPIGVSIRSITTKMLESAVSLRITEQDFEGTEDETRRGKKSEQQQPFDERVFVERHLKSLTRAIASAVNARYARFVHVISVQRASDHSDKTDEDELGAGGGGGKKKHFESEDGIRRWTRRIGRSATSGGGVDVLIAVQKSRSQDYFKPEYIRKTLEQKLDEVERIGGVKIVSLVTETCRPDRCKNGGVCRERLHLYEIINNAILTETYSFVSPAHRRWAECVCAVGFGGDTCQTETNECAKKPCSAGRVCVPSTTNSMTIRGGSKKDEKTSAQKGYRCVCAGIGCPGYDSVHLMSPRSWIRYTLSENLETEMRFSMVFRTVARSGVLLYSGGRTDFQSLELFGGQLRYRYDLGDGETLVYVDGRPSVDDGQWHTVRVERHGRTAKLWLDDHRPQVVNAPGDAFVLNLHGADVYLGSGRSIDSGFVGCLKEPTLNDDVLPWHGAGVQLYDVDVGLCTDDEFKRILTTAAGGMKNSCGWCLNNGTCINGDSRMETAWSCVCPAPFTGLRCETLVTKHQSTGACASSPCRNGGTCVLDRKSEIGFRCQCPVGFVGRTCLVSGSDPCASNPCANGGLCVKITSASGGAGFFCNCTNAWIGTLCEQGSGTSPNIVGGFLGITVPELIGIIAIFLVLILLTVVIVLLCRRQRSFRRKKFQQRRGPLSSGAKHGENEPMFSESNVTPSMYAQRSFGGGGAQNMLVSGGPCGAMVVVSDPNSTATPMSPAACSLPATFGNGNNGNHHYHAGPPPLPPRQARGFQPHRGSKLSNLESALQTGIPTVQVRPLSMSERQPTPVDGGRATGGGYLETAANYGSAAEELEQLGRRSPTFDDLEDWKSALNRMNADSLEKLKAAAGITDEYWQNEVGGGSDAACGGGGPPSSTGNNAGAPSGASIQCLPEEEKSNPAYHWDYSDWNSTMGHNTNGGGGGGRGGPQASAGPYATLSHLSVATDDDYGTSTLPRGVCRLEETDTEYAANESGAEDHDNEDDGTRSEAEVQKSRLRGDEFTKELIALTRAFGRQRIGNNSESDEGASASSSKQPILSTFKGGAAVGTNGGCVNSYLDRYLPRQEPPNSTASERKLLLSNDTTENTSAVQDQFSDDEDEEEFTTPSAGCQSSLLDASRTSEMGGGTGASSDGERSTDSVVLAAASTSGGGAGVKREDSALIVCSISDDEETEHQDVRQQPQPSTKPVNGGSNNNRTYLKKSKKQTQV